LEAICRGFTVRNQSILTAPSLYISEILSELSGFYSVSKKVIQLVDTLLLGRLYRHFSQNSQRLAATFCVMLHVLR
jgi:hypothetical protein